jgi:uncharacterized protein involved in exopolysaccharide biosynthesis
MQHNEPATLLDVLAELRRAKAWIIAGIVLGAALAFLYLGAVTPFYKAQMIVGPANPISNDESAGEAAGVHPARNNSANALNFTRFESTLAGPAVAGVLLKDEKIFQGLIEDSPHGLLPAQTAWSPGELSDYVRRRVRIEPVGETQLRRLVYFHPSQDFAAYFLARLQEVDDALIRRSIRTEAAERVRYLQKSSAALANPDHRRGLTSLLMEQERLLMLASLDQPYAATIVEPAASSYRPVWPSRALVLAAFILSGAILGFVVHGFRRG